MQIATLSRSSTMRSEREASVFISVGGTFQAVAEYPEAASADRVCYLDVPLEVEGVSLSDGVVPLRLAAGETLGKLVESYGSQGLKDFLSERPAINLQVGCGQVRAVGKLVGEHIEGNKELKDFLFHEIFEPLLIKHNGYLPHVTIHVDSSFAGATGSVVAEIVARAVSKLIRDFSNATVLVYLRRVGSLTFTQLGDRVHANTAATLAEDMEFLLSPERDDREMRCLEVVEMPMVGPQKERRDSFVMAYLQGISAPAVRTWLDRTSPNEALNSRFGTVRVVQASFGRPLSDRQVAAEVAGPFAAVIEDIMNAPPTPGVGEEFKVITKEEAALNVATVQEIGEWIKSARGVRGPDLWAQCSQVPIRVQSEGVLTNDREQERVPLRKRIIADCRTVAEWEDKIGTLQALLRGLRRELQEREEPLRRARQQVAEATTHLQALFNRFFPKNWWMAVRAVLSDPVTSLVKLQNAVIDFREKAADVAKLQCEYLAVTEAAVSVEEELAAESKRLGLTLDLLRAVGSRSTANRLVRPSSLDPVLAELVQEAVKQPVEVPERVYRMLASCVGKVNLAGLAAIVDSPEVRPATVAYHMTHQEPVTRGPSWGGRRRLGPTQKILVLPPMPGDVFDDLRQLVTQHDPSLILAMAETARGVVNAVYLEIFSPRHATDIFTPFHRQYLRKAMEEPHLFFTKQVDPERWLEDRSLQNGRRPASCDK